MTTPRPVVVHWPGELDDIGVLVPTDRLTGTVKWADGHEDKARRDSSRQRWHVLIAHVYRPLVRCSGRARDVARYLAEHEAAAAQTDRDIAARLPTTPGVTHA